MKTTPRSISDLFLLTPRQEILTVDKLANAVGWPKSEFRKIWGWDYHRLDTLIQEQMTDALNVNLDMLTPDKVVVMHGSNYFMMSREEAKAQGHGPFYHTTDLEEGIKEMEKAMKELGYRMFDLRNKVTAISDNIEELRWSRYNAMDVATHRIGKPKAAEEEEVFDQQDYEQLRPATEWDQGAKDEIDRFLAKYPETIVWKYREWHEDAFDSTDILVWFMSDNMAPLLILWEYMDRNYGSDSVDDGMNLLIYDDDRVSKIIVTKIVGPHWLTRSEEERNEILKGEVSIPATDKMSRMFEVLAGYRQRLKKEAGDSPDEA